MSVHRNNKAVASIFRGEQPIGKAYKGDRLVFQKGGGALDFLNFTAVEDGSSVKYTKGTYESAEYSYDKVSWADANNVVISLNQGQKVYFRGVIQSTKAATGSAKFTMTGKIAAGGSIQSMRNGDPLDDLVTESCYNSMFNGCTSLTQAPKLPATTLATQCYNSMFNGCTSLTQAPKLPATTLATQCYLRMFYNCTALTEAPELPATTLARGCYDTMFYKCTSLTTAPKLPATTLATQCYNSMFNGCTSLTQAPKLPATTLATQCYQSMFYGCTSLTQAHKLPATTLEEECYSSMFYGCTSLIQAPELPATTLAGNCYFAMFQGCTSLIQAPELPATTLAGNCYRQMFSGCTLLNYIKTYATNISAQYCLANWVNGISNSGTFYKKAGVNYPSGVSGIPSGWSVVEF